MTHLRLVTGDLLADDFSVSVERMLARLPQLDELEQAVTIYRTAHQAMAELKTAVERRNTDEAIPALRRLLSAGYLAGECARRMEGGAA